MRDSVRRGHPFGTTIREQPSETPKPVWIPLRGPPCRETGSPDCPPPGPRRRSPSLRAGRSPRQPQQQPPPQGAAPGRHLRSEVEPGAGCIPLTRRLERPGCQLRTARCPAEVLNADFFFLSHELENAIWLWTCSEDTLSQRTRRC